MRSAVAWAACPLLAAILLPVSLSVVALADGCNALTVLFALCFVGQHHSLRVRGPAFGCPRARDKCPRKPEALQGMFNLQYFRCVPLGAPAPLSLEPLSEVQFPVYLFGLGFTAVQRTTVLLARASWTLTSPASVWSLPLATDPRYYRGCSFCFGGMLSAAKMDRLKNCWQKNRGATAPATIARTWRATALSRTASATCCLPTSWSTT